MDFTIPASAPLDSPGSIDLLHVNEAMFRLVTDSLPALLSYLDRDLTYRYVNQTYSKWFAVPLSAVLGQTVDTVLGEEAAARFRPYMQRALAGEVVQYESWAPYPQRPRYIKAVYIPDRAEDGSVRGFVVLVEDISERRRAEEALRESETRFRNMADNAPVMVWVTEPDGYCSYLSRSWREFTGQKDGLGFEWLGAVHPEDRVRSDDCFSSANEKREPFQLEYRLKRADGEWRWCIDTAAPRFGAGGEFLGYVGSVIDITERKQTEELLRKANADLEQFAYTAAHDLQEPLRNITIYSELLERRAGSQLDDSSRRQMGFIVDGAKRMQALVTDLLTYTRLSSTEDPSESIDVQVVVQESLANLLTLLEESSAVVTAGPLPRVCAHRARIAQLFQNLISNAVKYSKPEEAPRIDIQAYRKDSLWVFSVEDNGIGIPPDYHERIFGVFKRLHGRETSGTGIGLAICKRIVEHYGGRIWVDSDGQGNGSTFYFTLPAA